MPTSNPVKVKVATKFYGVISIDPAVPAFTLNAVVGFVLSVLSNAAVNLTLTLVSGMHSSNFI